MSVESFRPPSAGSAPGGRRAAFRRISPVTTPLALAAAGVALLAVRDPHRHFSYGVCPSFALFGVYCPFCGGLRAVNDLTRFDPLAAVSSNALVVLGAPFVLAWAALIGIRLWHGRDRPTLPRWAGVTALMTLVAFTVLRNVALGGALAP